jgi:glycosyltransferase involved in cell wall biosynthesis
MSRAEGPRAALVHDWLTGMRGGEKVLESLALLLPGAPIYTLFHFAGSLSKQLEERPIRTSSLQHAPGLRRHYRRYLPFFPAAIEEHDLGGFDLVVSSSHCVAKGVIPPPGARHLCYCHTPMRYAWDQEHAYFPRRTGVVARLRSAALSRLRTWDVASSSRVDRFVANSSFVARRIRRYYGRSADVVPPPVDTDFFTPDDAPRGQYCLVVSALSPYKRVDLAIAACAESGHELRIVGEGPELDRLRRQAGEGVRFLGRVDDEQLRQLYRGAYCFVQPQIEDFGIAAVEALACGCPVVARREGGVLDIAQDGQHGVLYDPGTASGEADVLAAAIRQLDQLVLEREALRRRAELFSERQFRDRMSAQIAEVAIGGGQDS